jgi:hypothetical protein
MAENLTLKFNNKHYLYATVFTAINLLYEIHNTMITFQKRLIFLGDHKILAVNGALVLQFGDIAEIEGDWQAYEFTKFTKSEVILMPVDFNFKLTVWQNVMNFINAENIWLTADSKPREVLHEFIVSNDHSYSLQSQEYRRLIQKTPELNCQYNFAMFLILPNGQYQIYRHPEMVRKQIGHNLVNCPRAAVIRNEKLDLLALVSPTTL